MRPDLNSGVLGFGGYYCAAWMSMRACCVRCARALLIAASAASAHLVSAIQIYASGLPPLTILFSDTKTN